MPPLLQVRDLQVCFGTELGLIPALRGVDFDLPVGEVLGVLGESGAGKTTLGLALLQVLPPAAHVRGSVRFEGRELVGLEERELRAMRGARLAIVFQEPAMSLDPVMQIGTQICHVLRSHGSYDGRHCRARAASVLAEVGLADHYYSAYPHELSGGQRQRVAIAQALCCEPSVLIADEATSNLDASTQAEILELFIMIKQRLRIAFVFITHDPALLSGFADRIMVMYAGQVVEQGKASSIYEAPLHPYTAALLRCVPHVQPPARRGDPLATIAGNPPDAAHLPLGCAFEPRCNTSMPICRVYRPATFATLPNRSVRCFKYAA